jgi:hypothetical protein
MTSSAGEKSDTTGTTPSPLSEDEDERGVMEESVIMLPLAVLAPPAPAPPNRRTLPLLELPESEREMAMPLGW